MYKLSQRLFIPTNRDGWGGEIKEAAAVAAAAAAAAAAAPRQVLGRVYTLCFALYVASKL